MFVLRNVGKFTFFRVNQANEVAAFEFLVCNLVYTAVCNNNWCVVIAFATHEVTEVR